MKTTILQNKLKTGLNIVEKISGKSLTLPVLSNILLSTEKNFLQLSGTDLEVGVNWWILVKTEKEGQIAVPARVLSSFINLLPEKQISLIVKDKVLSIECENFKNQIKGLGAEDFPIIPKVPRESFVEVESIPFCQGLSQVVDIAIPSAARPEISGIYFCFQKESIKIAATDSFRLGEKTFLFEKSDVLSKTGKDEISFILPQKTAKQILNIFGEKEGGLKIYFSSNQVLFETLMPEVSHPQGQLISRLIEGEYPNYQEIIPKKSETQIVLNKGEFLNQIKIASLFSGKINEIKFKVDPIKKGIEILSQNPDLGEHHSFLKGETKGEGLEVSFNHRFLTEGLLNIKSPEVIFGLSGEGGAGVLKPVGDASYIYVVMPIKAS